MLLVMIQQGHVQPGADAVSTPGCAVDAAPPQKFPTTPQKLVRIFSQRPAG
jgi:hypothetical protein